MPLSEVQKMLDAAQGAEEAVDRQGVRSPVQRQPAGVRSAAARSDRLGHAERRALRSLVSERLRQAIPVAIGLVLFLVALEVLRVELRTVTWHELTADVLRTPPSRLGLALVLTALNYAALTGYDLLAFAYIGKTPSARDGSPWRRFWPTRSPTTSGFAMLSGASVRYRFYTRWGVTAEELSRIVVFVLGDVLAGAVRAGRTEPRRQPAAERARAARRTSCWRRSAGC